jgi:hypothetical protein
MDAIGVGSLTIIILTGFFTGGVLTVQTFRLSKVTAHNRKQAIWSPCLWYENSDPCSAH